MNAALLARRPLAMLSVAAVLAGGLVLVEAAAPPAASAALPDGAEGFIASHSGEGDATAVDMTSDSQRVAFVSTATDLVAGDVNETSDVFLSTAVEGSSPFSGDAVLVSVGIGGTPANGTSSEPTVSADGRYVAFTSSATDLVADPITPGRRHIYIRDVVEGTTVRVQGTLGEPDGDSYDPDFSADGRTLVFTSEATNLVAGDVNGFSDVFVLDRDPDVDGILDVVQPALLFTDDGPLPAPSYDPAVSGDGTKVAFVVGLDGLGSGEPVAGVGPFVWWIDLRQPPGTGRQVRLAEGGSRPAIDARGGTVASAVDGACDATGALIVASFVYGSSARNIALGTDGLAKSAGTASHAAVSSDGATISWESTQPRHDSAVPNPPALPEAVIRVQEAPAFDAWTAERELVGEIACGGIHQQDWVDLGVGTGPSVSAGGRTVAYSGPAPAPLTSAAPTTVVVLDRHTHDGLSVTSTQGQLAAPGIVTAINQADIPTSEIRGYASALANAPIHRIPIHRIPIHRIPIHRIPIHRIPIHRIPIHRIPIHRIDIPGGWPELLAGTPFETQPSQTIVFGDVLDWADANAPAGSAATPAQRAAAQRIQTLTIGDVGLDNSGIDALTIASLVLGDAKLAQVVLPGATADTADETWQAIVDAQGVDATIGAETVLAELDYAGIDISLTGVEGVSLASLPISDTLLDSMPAQSLILAGSPLGELPVSALTASAQAALFGRTLGGTIADNTSGILATATVADLARGVPAAMTLGDLLFSLVDRASFPWEQIDPASVDVSPIGLTSASCPNNDCSGSIAWEFAFDPGPGEDTVFPSPLATLELPAGTSQAYTTLQGAGPNYRQPRDPYSGAAVSEQEHVEFPFADVRGGTTLSLSVSLEFTTDPTANLTTASLVSGDLEASDQFEFGRELASYDDPAHNYDPQTGEWVLPAPGVMRDDAVYYGWISTAYFRFNEETGTDEAGPAQDEDYYRVSPPAPGKRLVVSTNASDGQIVLSLYSPSSASSPLGIPSTGAAPGTPVTEQAPGTVNAPAESGADAGAEVKGQTLVDQAAVGGSGSAQVEAAGVSSPSPMLLRVTSGNGRPSDTLYSLRVQYIDEPAEQVCAPWTAPQTADPGTFGTSDVVAAATNTVYVVDTKRFGDTHGAAAAASLRTALRSVDGTGTVGAGSVQSAVLSVDEDASAGGVRAARAALDENPCSMSARATLTREINEFVSLRIGAERAHISSIVIVGGDDIIPFAPVAQHTSQFNEASHAADLRLETQPGGGACPSSVEVGAIDPCATPLSAAAATNYILTDDAYGLAQAYESLGGQLYVPTVGVGRLVETPAQISATLARFVASDGRLTADSTLTAGYEAWSELPDVVTDALRWRTDDRNDDLGADWTAADVQDLLRPDAGAPTARVVSLNAHANETQLQPGAPGSLLEAGSLMGAEQLGGALVFTIGCHAGGNLPSAYYGDVPDWADVFSTAAGYVGNTGYGLASSTTTALSERVLALYADWIGVTGPNGPVSSAGALTYAKQSYLGGFGLYSGYDEKALMESVYYGLPMYTFTAPDSKALPLPKIPPSLVTSHDMAGNLTAASLTLEPLFQTSDADDAGTRFLVAGDDERGGAPTAPSYQQPLVIDGQPVLPSLVYSLEPKAGKTPRGALITELTSEFDSAITKPTVAQANVGVEEPTAQTAGGAFPSVFAQVLRQETPNGPLHTLAVTPARVETGTDGSGRVEKFTRMSIDVVYGDEDAGDTVTPGILSTRMSGNRFEVTADGTGSDVVRTVLLVQRQSTDGTQGGAWDAYDLDLTDVDTSDTASVAQGEFEVPVGNGEPFRWFLQVVDAAGNVAIDTSRGRLDVGATTAPTLEAVPTSAVTVGDRLLRTVEVTDASPNDRLTATYALSDKTGTSHRGGPAAVKVGADGKTRVVLDEVFATTGGYTAVIEVCRGTACATTSFDLDVVPVTALPTITTTATNAAGGYAADTWSRSAVTVAFVCAPAAAAIADCSPPRTIEPDTAPDGVFVAGTVVDAAGGTASAGIRVRVDATAPTALSASISPSGPFDIGDAAVATLTATDAGSGIATAVCEQPDTSSAGTRTITCTATDRAGNSRSTTVSYTVTSRVSPPPTIVATATSGGQPYTAGEWSRLPVEVTFACADGAPPVSCSPARTIAADTEAAGELVSGTAEDASGRTAEASVLVRVDATPPTLAPTATPDTVMPGESPIIAANATDAASGIASQSCTSPSTTTPGQKTSVCQATDAAGNTASASVTFTVQAPPPAPPTITATATVAGAPYTAGTWSTAPVRIAYTCTSGVAVTSCPPVETVSADTTAAGLVIARTTTDALGRTATASVTVKIDRTAPVLAPTATPSTVTVGGSVVVAANAADAASGIASQSCDAPTTATPGTKAVTCRATDVAGNTATSTATYIVTAPAPRQCQGLPDRTPLLALNADGSSVFLRTSGVPIVFRACDAAGRSIGTKGYVTSVTLVSTSNLPSTAKINEIWYLPIGSFT
ncbi:MAG: hypothetical protein ABW004_07830 [Aeromicrobium sp.]